MIDPLESADEPTEGLPPGTPPPPSQQPQSRKLPFSTLLELTEDQERNMVDKAILRIEALKAEMGWMDDQTCPDRNTWMGKREVAEKKMANDLRFRAQPNADGSESIFQFSNVSLNTVKHQVIDLAAATINNTIGTRPFFTTMPIGDEPEASPDPNAPVDPETDAAGEASPLTLAKLIELCADDKLDRSNLESGLRQALATAVAKGEQVLKIAHRENVTHSRDRDWVLCDAQGKPFYTAGGEAIYQSDAWTPGPEGIEALEKDPKFMRAAGMPGPEGTSFQLAVYDRTIVHYRGPDISPVHSKSWLCPLNVPDIHEGTNVFLYDLPAQQVAELFNQSPNPAPETKLLLRDLENETSAPKTPVSQPNETSGEGEPSGNQQGYGVIQIAEFYDRIDADGDGRAEEIFLVLDLKNRRALYFNYLDQVFPSGRRPFEVITRGRKDNRWFGTGLFEQFEKLESFVDTNINRANYRESAAGRMDFVNPKATRQGMASEPLAFGNRVPYELNDTFTAETAYSFISIPPLSEGVLALMERAVHSIQTEGANVSNADASSSGLNSSKTAYGIRNIEQNKDTLQGRDEREMQMGVEKVIQAAVDCAFFHMEDVEKFSYREKDKQILRTLTREQIRNFRFKVRLSLLQKQTQANLQNIQLAVGLGKEYMSLPKPMQRSLRQLYIEQMKILKVQEAETALPDPETLPDPAPPAPPPVDVPDLIQSIASLVKSGVQLTRDDFNALLAQANLPPLPGNGNEVVGPPPNDTGTAPGIAPVPGPPSIAPSQPVPPPMPQLANAA